MIESTMIIFLVATGFAVGYAVGKDVQRLKNGKPTKDR